MAIKLDYIKFNVQITVGCLLGLKLGACSLVVMTPPLQGGDPWFDPRQAHVPHYLYISYKSSYTLYTLNYYVNYIKNVY